MEHSAQDLYELIGADPSSTPTQLRTAWRETARRLHPDTGPGSSEAFIAAKDAYDILADPARRRAYDTERMASRLANAARRQSPPPTQAHAETQVEPAPERTPATEWGQPGLDLKTTLTINFSAAVFGTTTEVTVSRRDRCSSCSGFPPPRGCSVCGHEGFVLVDHTTRVDVSPGATTGQVITVFAGGDVGERAGEPGNRHGLLGAFGDLLIEVVVTPTPGVIMLGADLIYDFPVDVIDALLGTLARPELLDGPATVVVPPGAVSGLRLKVAGRGVPVPGLERGDAYLEVRLLMRTDLTAAQRAVLEALRNSS